MKYYQKKTKLFSVFSRIKQQISKWRGDAVERNLGSYEKYLRKIEEIKLTTHSDSQLKKISLNLKQQARKGIPLSEIMIDTYALVREVIRRVLGMRAFGVQIMAAIALHQKKMVEMPTGEGKTLVAVFPACLNALSGKGVHVFTANDYLARRDAEWMGPVYRFLDLKVTFIREGMNGRERKKAYASDITYITAKEAGFDFLRDHLCIQKHDIVQRAFNWVIVDEADFIMIDEARVPLVIAGKTDQPDTDPHLMAKIARNLQQGKHYKIDENGRNVFLTEEGIERVENILNCGKLHNSENQLLHTSINLALHAQVLLHRDIDYIIRKGKVELVDEFTGRVADKRRWPDGIQSAVEAKEQTEIQAEGIVLGSITIQHFLQLYPNICGMTATATPAAEEFRDIYGLQTTVIPPHKPCIRIDHPDAVFKNKEEKYKGVIEEIKRVNANKRPILVGTSCVEESEKIAGMLDQINLKCQVLNAKNHEEEAKIIANAGSLNAITISTNMAGRGTDIRLGGQNEKDHNQVVRLGGLYVMGTNRHESLRIDYQLRGRAGRQGDPGSTRFFICLEDDLPTRYGDENSFSQNSPLLKKYPQLDIPIIQREMSRLQRVVEGQNSEIRKTLHQYSTIVEQQRKIVYEWRQNMLSEKQFDSLLEERSFQRLKKLRRAVGDTILNKVEKQITLYHIDQFWPEHLSQINDIRESIHLFRLSGKIPLEEFHKKVNNAFNTTIENIEDAVVKTFNSAQISERGINLNKEGLKRPSSTWTYLINDNPFSDLGMFLIANRNIGFAAGAVAQLFLYGPIMMIVLFIKKIRTRLMKKSGQLK